jgi:uncharacterized membrane protein
MESFGGLLKVKKFVNRGFLIGPYCPVYGTGVVLITLLLKNYTNDIPVLFVLTIVICGTLEYATSYFMEKLFNARWWDYHNRKFNINGRICLETLIPFGIAGSVILCITNPFFINLYTKIPDIWRHIITGGLVILFIVDCIISFIIILSFKGETYTSKDNTEEISTKVKDKTEEIIMKAESDAIVFTRRLKLGSLKLERKAKYTRKKISNAIMLTPKELATQISNSREKLDNQIKIRKEKLEEKQKATKNALENTIKKRKDDLESFQKTSKELIGSKFKNIKMSSEEFNNQIKNKFKKKSLLSKRLMDAFPNLEIKPKVKKTKEKKSKRK